MSDTIREIISTYELPRVIEETLLFRLNQDERFLSLGSYTDKYRYIQGLVEGYQKDPVLRRAFSLDAPLEEGSRKTFHEKIGNEDNTSLEIRNIGYLLGMNLYHAVSLAQSFLSEEQRQLLQTLKNKSNIDGETYLESLDILAEHLLINERIEVLFRLLRQDNRFRQPERRMVYVNLDLENPFIRWGRRNFNGNPLDYFRRHKDVYGKMSRGELSGFDQSLYVSLRKHTSQGKNGNVVRQLEIAIPESQGVPWLSEEDKNSIVAMHELSDKNAAETARRLGFNKDTILRCWRKDNLQILERGQSNTLSVQEKEKILVAYEEFDGNARRAARSLEYGRTTVRDLWMKHGLKPKGYGVRFQYPQETIDKVLRAYESNNGNALTTAKQLNVGRTTVKEIWKRHGLKPKGKGGWNAREQKVV